MGLLDGLEQKPKPKVKKEKEYKVEIDLDDGKVIPTKPTHKSSKSKLSEISPDRVFCTNNAFLTQDEYEFIRFCMNKHRSGKLTFNWNNLKKKLWKMREK